MKTPVHSTVRTLTLTGMLAASLFSATAFAQTPASAGCQSVQAASGTPASGMSGMGHGAAHGSTPMAGMQDVEFDLMYIDMMVPHHQSIIALAEVAQHELTHPRLVEIARAIVETQSAENETLLELREEWYGDAETVSMEMMMQGMPGMGTDMEMMMQQMDAGWQVQAFCAAEDKDLAFIEQVIPHHQMAIDASTDALEKAVHPDLKEIAQDVIDAQEAEIQELETIKGEIIATPAA